MSGLLLPALSAFVLLYVPGRALLPPSAHTSSGAAFARVLASVICSTVAGTALAAFGSFSLGALLSVDLAAALTALVARRITAGPARPLGGRPPSRDYVAALVVAAALMAYWPAYPAFLGASDSTAYVATGISLAHHGDLGRDDELGSRLSPIERYLLFDSMSQAFGGIGPPYRRMPGAMMINELGADRAWPCFFPVPAVWSAVFASTGLPGLSSPEEAAPGYAPLFAALALWAFWLLARCWLGAGWALLAVALLAASGPFYYFARMPLSEPIAAYFTLSGLAILCRSGPRPSTADAVLAAAALGAAIFTRLEIAGLVALALAMLPLLQRPAGSAETSPTGRQRLPPAFFAVLGISLALTAAEAALVPGTWSLVVSDQLRNAWHAYALKMGLPSILAAVAGLVAAAAILMRVAGRIGWPKPLGATFVVATLASHAAMASFLYERTPMWLSFYVGWPGIVLAAAGLALAWRRSDLPAASAFVLGMAAATALLLFYNPHVYPALPWGARRFVPLLLPMMILLATYATKQVARRSRLVALGCVTLLVYEIAAGALPLWGKNFVEGAWDQLASIDALLPDDGTVFYDRSLSPLMIGPALWLIHDRNGLPISGPDTAEGHKDLPGFVSHYRWKGPVYLVTRGVGTAPRTPRVKMTLLGRTNTALRFPEQTHDRRPEKSQRYVLPVAVYRLDLSWNPRGETVR